MNLAGLLQRVRDIPAYRELLEDLRAGETLKPLSLLRAACPYLVAALARDLLQPIIWIVARPEQATASTEQARHWLPDAHDVLRFSEPEALPYITITPTFSICPTHGYLDGEHEFCPKCDAELIARKQQEQAAHV